MPRISVTRIDGTSFLADVDDQDKAPGPDGNPVDRLTVTRLDNGTKEYVLPGVDATVAVLDEVATPAPLVEGLDHLAPPPGQAPALPGDVQVVGSRPTPPAAPVQRMGAAPPPGSSIAGVSAPQVLAPNSAAPAAPSHPIPSLPERRFMVQSKGSRTTVYHTVSDCPRAGDQPTLPVDDRSIEFFDLTLCTSCAKLEQQVSWIEVVSTVAPGFGDAIAAAFEEYGFSVRPYRVERPSTEPEGEDDPESADDKDS